MITKIRQYILRLGAAGLLPVLLLAPAALVNAQSPLQESVCGGAENLKIGESGTCEETEPEDNINSLITTVVNIFSAIVGVIAVIMILYGGFKYITSGGDSGKISAAQQTIIYAIVGLVIVALAQIVVRFILGRTVNPIE